MTSGAFKTTTEDMKNLQKTCRLCLSEESLCDVFESQDLHQWILNYLSISITAEDRMSQAVCAICRIRLNEFHQFWERCQEVQDVLHSMIRNETRNVDSGIAEHVESELSIGSSDMVDIEEMKIETEPLPVKSSTVLYEVDQNKFIEGKDAVSQKQLFNCNVCNKAFNAKHTLRHHQRMTHGPKTHECHYCDVRFAFRSNLEQHLRSKLHMQKVKDHSIKMTEKTGDGTVIECNICFKRFADTTRLHFHKRGHRERHNTIKSYKCTICQTQFKNMNDFQRHSIKHSVVKPHECDICRKVFKRRAAVWVHKRRVHGSKTFDCTTCGYKFSNRFDHSRHVQSGYCEGGFEPLLQQVQQQNKSDIANGDTAASETKNEDPQNEEHKSGTISIKCAKCDKVYSNQKGLWVHYKFAHTERIKCPLCVASFVFEKRYLAHKEKYHS